MFFLESDAVEAARRLLGCYLVRTVQGKELVGRIVETEAYNQSDAASHSYKGRTPRTDVLFGSPGFAYVYFTYGMHYCMNVVTGSEGEGSAVLIRAIEPISEIEVMQKNRAVTGVNTTNGPAKLCQALAVDKKFNGHDLSRPPLRLQIKPAIPRAHIVTATRVGISKDTHRPWRFYIADSQFVSRR